MVLISAWAEKGIPASLQNTDTHKLHLKYKACMHITILKLFVAHVRNKQKRKDTDPSAALKCPLI